MRERTEVNTNNKDYFCTIWIKAGLNPLVSGCGTAFRASVVHSCSRFRTGNDEPSCSGAANRTSYTLCYTTIVAPDRKKEIGEIPMSLVTLLLHSSTQV